MILNCEVVFLLLSCFVFSISRGHEEVQGDLKQQLSNLYKMIKQIDENLQALSLDVKILKKKERDAEQLPTLTTGELIFYQHYDTGLKGIELYNKLMATNSGKSKENIIPILAKINSQYAEASTTELYVNLNNLGLAMLKNREETEIEAYFDGLDVKNNINTFLSTIGKIKSVDLMEFAKKALLNILKKENNADKIKQAMDYYPNDKKFIGKLIELQGAAFTKLPVSEALHEVKRLRSNEKINVFENLLLATKGTDLLKIVDAILSIDEPDMEPFMELRKKIPYSDDYLKEIVKNSTESFESPKMKAFKIQNQLEIDPNDQKIVDLLLNLDYSYPRGSQDHDLLEATMNKLPKTLSLIVAKQKFCLMNEGRYLYAGENGDLLVSEKNSKKPDRTLWKISTATDKEFYLQNEAYESERVIKPNYGERIKLQDIWSYDSWILTFSDSFTRVKFGDRYQFFKIKENYVVLDDIATIWDVITTC